jgi:hypothetical protein
MMGTSDTCPSCSSNLQGETIPEEHREMFGGKTHFSRLIGVEIQGLYDGVAYWKCPDCGHEWERFPGRFNLELNKG